MKLVMMAVAAVLLAGGLGVACGPKEKYCYAEGMTCVKVRLDRVRACEDRNALKMDAGMTSGLEDCTQIPLTVEPADGEDDAGAP